MDTYGRKSWGRETSTKDQEEMNFDIRGLPKLVKKLLLKTTSSPRWGHTTILLGVDDQKVHKAVTHLVPSFEDETVMATPPGNNNPV